MPLHIIGSAGLWPTNCNQQTTAFEPKLRMQESVNHGTYWPLIGIGICVGGILTSIQDDKDDQCLVPAHSRILERRARCNFILGFQDVR